MGDDKCQVVAIQGKKTEKKPWMVLISVDCGNKRVLEYLREKGSNIMIV